MSKKYKNTTGYRLHRDRILFSGGQTTRSIKFPLKSLAETENLKREFEQAIIADDLKIRGDANLNDFINYTLANNKPYTLFDFWVDSLKAGVIWSSKPTELTDLINNLYNLGSPIDEIWGKASPNIRKFFSKERFKALLLSGSMRSNKNREAFRRQLTEFLKDNYKDKEKEENSFRITNKEAENLVNSIVNSFFDRQGKLVLNGKKQTAFWKNEFGLNKHLAENGKIIGEFEKITFVIIPELVAIKNIDSLIDSRRKWLKQRGVNDNQARDYLEQVLGLTPNFNGFSNYLGVALKGLRKGKIEDLYKTVNSVYPSTNNSKEKVFSSLRFLSDKVKLLESPKTPKLSGWHEYRSNFGGKIQSWFKSYIKRESELDDQIKEFKKSLKKAKDFLNSSSFPEEAKGELEEIKPLINRLELLVLKHNLKSAAEYQIFDSLLSSLKRRLNFFYQAYIQKEGDDETRITDFKALKGLYKKVYKPVAFYGEAARRTNNKVVYKTIPILEDGIDLIFSLLSHLKSQFSPSFAFKKEKRKNETEESIYRKQLQFLWSKYKDKAINTQEFKNKYIQLLQFSLKDKTWWEKITKNSDKYAFYRSSYAKGTLDEVVLKSDNFFSSLEEQTKELVNFANQFKREALLNSKNDAGLLLDWIDLSRNLIASLVRFNKREEFGFTDLKLGNFDKARDYLELFKLKAVNKKEFAFIIQSLILSEIKGAATLYSKKKYLSRYTIQVVGSDKKFKVFYSSKEKEITPERLKDGKYLAVNPHQYFVAIDDFKSRSPQGLFTFINLQKQSLSSASVDKEAKNKLLKISSSPYQIQFLDKFIFRPKGWENIDIALNEWSFIVEREFTISWDLEKKQPVLEVISNSKKNKLYVSIPFQLKAKTKREDSPLFSPNRANYPILGVDVGEYGLAWVLAKFEDSKINLLNKGFIEDKNIANIKDKFAEIQQKSRLGAFDEQSSLVALVRENAVGALRNRIHFVLTQNNSSVVYEASISNFETGSGRTTKIYNSVKRADLYSETKADTAEKQLIWGVNKYKMFGRELSAYASSYTCSKCAKSLFQISQTNLQSVVIEKKEGNIIEINTPYGKIRGYGKDKKYQSGFPFKNNENGLKDFRKLVKDFSRPPVNSKSEVLNKFAQKLAKDNVLENFKKRRGNSSVFVCPFADCHHVSDADIQAAFMMAIRGYFNFTGRVKSIRGGKKKKPSSGESYLKETNKFLNEELKEKQVIGLDLTPYYELN